MRHFVHNRLMTVFAIVMLVAITFSVNADVQAIGEDGDDILTAPVPDRLAITVDNAEFITPIFTYQFNDAEEIVSIAFSHNSRVLAIMTRDGLITLLDTTTGNVWKTMQIERSTGGEILFSADSRMLIVEAGRFIQVWDVVRGEMVNRFGGYGSPVRGIALSADGEILAAGYGDVINHRDYVVRLWDWRTGQQVGVAGDLSSPTSALDFHPSRRYLAAADSFGEIRVWDVTQRSDPQLVGVLQWHDTRIVYALLFSSDGRYIVSTGNPSGVVKFWDIESGGIAFTVNVDADFLLITLNPSGRVLATARSLLDRASIRVWDVQHNTRLLSLDNDETSVTALTFSPDGTLLVAGGNTGHITIWGLLEQ